MKINFGRTQVIDIGVAGLYAVVKVNTKSPLCFSTERKNAYLISECINACDGFDTFAISELLPELVKASEKMRLTLTKTKRGTK